MSTKEIIHTSLEKELVRKLYGYSQNGKLNNGIETVVKLLDLKNKQSESDKVFLNDIADRIVMNGTYENHSDIVRLRNIAKYGRD